MAWGNMQEYLLKAGVADAFAREATMAPPGCWPDLQEPRFLHVLRHWAERRKGPITPRSAIDPAAIRNCLSNVWIYQYLPAEDDFVCTLSGEGVNQAWGQSLIGKRVSQIMPAAIKDRVQLLYRSMLLMPAVQFSQRRILPNDGVAQSADRLIVPLSRDDGSPYGIFGITIYYLGRESILGDPRDIQGTVTFYDCNTLPGTLPGA
jgi:hypothetical protein